MGLIIPRNPLAFPGGNAGLNPKHVAYAPLTASGTPGMRYVGVAQGANMRSLLTGAKATVSGTLTSGTNITGSIVTNGTGSGFMSSPGYNEALTSVTFAAIYTFTANNSNNFIFSNNGNAVNSAVTALDINASQPLLFMNGGTNVPANMPTLVAGQSYFIAISKSGGTGGVISGVVVNLASGKTWSGRTTDTSTIGTPTSSLYVIGGNTTLGGMDGSLAAVMYSTVAMPLPQLMLWAASPWDFWYPPTVGQTIFSSLSGSVPPNTGTLAITESADTFAFLAANANNATLSVTESADTFAFAGADANTGTLSVTESADTFVFSGSNTNSGSLSVTEATDTFAFAGSDVNAGTVSVTEAADTFAFSGETTSGSLAITEVPDTFLFDVNDIVTGALALTEAADTFLFDVTVIPPAPQPGPQKLYPLRERTYRRRFLGVGYDPICVITKDRPGPMRIIEFVGEIKDE